MTAIDNRTPDRGQLFAVPPFTEHEAMVLTALLGFLRESELRGLASVDQLRVLARRYWDDGGEQSPGRPRRPR